MDITKIDINSVDKLSDEQIFEIIETANVLLTKDAPNRNELIDLFNGFVNAVGKEKCKKIYFDSKWGNKK